MAKRIVHTFIDDLDETPFDEGQGETVLFGLDGKAFEIDLTNDNAKELRATFEKYISAGRRTSASVTSIKASGRRRPGQIDLAPVREWARKNGFTVSERGRVPQAILEAYQAAS